MNNREYLNYTDYILEPAGIRRVDFVLDKIKEYAGTKEKSQIKILDAGCGNGNVSLPVAYFGYDVLGVDPDQKSISIAKEKNKFTNAKYQVSKVEDIAGSFDVIIANEVFEHLPDPVFFAKVLYRLLKKDGILLISIPNGWSTEESIRFILTKSGLGRKIKLFLRKNILKQQTVQTYAESPHLHYFTWGQFKKLLSSTGFKVIKRKNISFVFKQFFYIFLRMFMRRGSRMFIFLDQFDNLVSDFIPEFLADGWMVMAKKK